MKNEDSEVARKLATILNDHKKSADEADDSSLNPQSQPQSKGARTMATSQTLQAVSTNLKHGAKIAGSEEACKILVGIIRKTLGDSYPDFFNTDLGKMMEPLAVATVIHYLSTEYGFIPKAETVAKVAEFCMQGTGREVMASFLKQLEPAFEQIAGINMFDDEPPKQKPRKTS